MLLAVVFIIGAVVVSVPLIAVMLVSVASRQEDSAWSLGGPARGSAQSAARRILGFHSQVLLRAIRPPAAAGHGAGRPRLPVGSGRR